MAMKHVVLGGGTGFIGKYIKRELLNRGAKCTVISRMPGPNNMSWNDLERYGLPNDTSAVINVAGQNVLDPLQGWSKGFQQNVRNSRIQTTKSLAEAVVATKAVCFATISGVAYYKPNNVEYTEDSKCEPYDFLSELCHDWEAAAKLPENSPVRQVTIRSGVVIGPKGGIILTLYVPFWLCVGSRISSGKQYMPWIHAIDLANLFMFALENYNVRGILNGVAPQVITNKEFTKAFAKAMHRPAFLITHGWFLKLLFGRDRATMLLKGQKVIPHRVQQLGFKYQFPDIQSACKHAADNHFDSDMNLDT